MYLIKYVNLFLTLSLIGYGDCCTFPTDLQDGTWQSNDMGDVTFTSTHFTVTNIAAFGAMTFACTEQSGNRYYSISERFDFLGGNKLRAAMCFKLTKMTSYKYSYFPYTNVLANTDVNRILLKESSYAFTSAETCALSTTSPSQARLFIKSGYANETAQTCYNPLASVFEYSVTGSSCNVTSLNVCNDSTQLVFNYTTCSDEMAYSAGGQLYCMWSTEIGDDIYTLLYNQDATTDESTYYRFVCLISTANSTDNTTTTISTYPRACMDNQTSTYVVSPGITAVMVTTANDSCAVYNQTYENVTSSSSSTLSYQSSTYEAARGEEQEVLSAGAATAVALAVIILVVAGIVLGAVYYFKIYKKKKVTPDGTDGKIVGDSGDAGFIPAKSPPINTNIDSDKTGRVSPFSPYPTVSELACYRFGPEPATVDFDDDDGGMTLEATTPGFTEGRRTKYDKDNESIASLPVYSEVGDPTPDPTRLSEVQTVLSDITVVNNTDPTPFTMTRATMNIPEENTVSPMESPRA